MRDIALTLIFAVLAWGTILQPWIGIITLSWFSYMNPHRLAYGFAHLFPFVAIAAGLTMFSWLMSREKKPFPWSREVFLEILFILWFTITTITALNTNVTPQGTTVAWDYWDRAFKVQIEIFMTLLILRTRFQLEALVWTIVISIGFYGIKGGLWALLTGGHHRVYGPPQSFIEDNNTLAVALVMTIPLMRYLQVRAQRKLVRWGLAAAQVLTVLATLATYSRGGLLAIGVVGVALLMKSRHKIWFALAIVLVALPLYKFMPAEWKERMRTLQTTDQDELDKSAKGRLNAWAFAINLAKDRPLVGGGFRVFISPEFAKYAPDPADRHDAHSIYFEVLGEHGFPGLALFLLMGISTWFTANRVVRKAKKIPELAWAADLVRMVQVALAGFATGGAFAGLAFFDLPYHLMAIVILCKVLVEEEVRRARRQALAMASTAAPEEVAV
ncbi:MAG TPA: putative O-glycosylation ligase, exosortase A system-associated [Bryobacteraceae bacterium]|nr:putative O-glycosylation ligase, exosortase A system-associated [Bryobacteraceae bacterium]